MSNSTVNLKYEPIGTGGRELILGVDGGTHIYAGTMLSELDATGMLVPTSTAASGPCVGVAEHEIDNSAGSDGAAMCQMHTDRIFAFANGTGGDACSAATLIGSEVFATDDHTVADNDGGGTRQRAGYFYGMEPDGKVRVFITPLRSPIETEVASLESLISDNLSTEVSDVASLESLISDAVSDEASLESVVSDNLSTAASDVASLESVVSDNLSTEASDVASLESVVSDNLSTEVSDIASLESVVSDNLSTEASDIASLESVVSDNLSTEVSDIASLESVVSDNLSTELSDVNSLESEVSDLASSMATLGRCLLPTSLYSFRETNGTGDVGDLAAHGGILASDSTPAMQGDGVEASEIVWVAGNTDPITTTVPVPPEFDEAQDALVELLVLTDNTNNDPAGFTVQTNWNGGAQVTDSANDGAVSGTAHVITATIAAADIPANAIVATITLYPDAHATDGVHLLGVRFLGGSLTA